MIYKKIKNYIKYNFENPYTTVENKYKCIFIHVPKTAGTSIAESLFGNIDPKMGHKGHKRIKHYFVYNQKKFQNYFKFAFVRNPWDRLYSAYNYLEKKKGNKKDKKFSEKYLNYESFKDFVYSLQKESKKTKIILSFNHFLPQHYFLKLNNELVIDKIGHFEKINKDFKEIKTRLDIKTKLKEKRKVKHKNYIEVYDNKMIRTVENIYKEDIKLFG